MIEDYVHYKSSLKETIYQSALSSMSVIRQSGAALCTVSRVNNDNSGESMVTRDLIMIEQNMVFQYLLWAWMCPESLFTFTCHAIMTINIHNTCFPFGSIIKSTNTTRPAHHWYKSFN